MLFWLNFGSENTTGNPQILLKPCINKMLRKQTLLLLILAAASTALFIVKPQTGSSNLQKEPKTVDHVDIARYLGPWYEQSVIPYYFERDCQKTTATYSMNTDGTVRVDNHCERNGRFHESVGKAFPDPADAQHTNAKLKVEFSSTLGIEANYWIVRLDLSAKDYRYSVVTSPNYEFLWVMYREPHMPEDLYNTIIADLKQDGYPVDKLRRTIQ